MSDFKKLIDELDPVLNESQEVTDKQEDTIEDIQKNTDELSDSMQELIDIRKDIMKLHNDNEVRQDRLFKKQQSDSKRKRKSSEEIVAEEVSDTDDGPDIGAALAGVLGIATFTLSSKTAEILGQIKLPEFKPLPKPAQSTSSSGVIPTPVIKSPVSLPSPKQGPQQNEQIRGIRNSISGISTRVSNIQSGRIGTGTVQSYSSPELNIFGQRTGRISSQTTLDSSLPPSRYKGFQRGGGVGTNPQRTASSSEDKKAIALIQSHEALSSFTPGKNDAVIPGNGNRSWISRTPWSSVKNDTKLYAYKDSEGIPTIGWGTVDQPSGKQTKMGDVITKAMADRWLEYKYLQFKKQIVPKLPTWNSMSDEQKAAILSYTYNAGANWPENDKNAYKALVSGDFHKAASYWTQGWSGQPELLKRRKEEADMIRSGPSNPLMGIVRTAYKKPIKRQQGGIVLFSGHGDISSGQTGTAGEKEAAKKVAKRIQDKTDGKVRYIPSQASWAFNGPQDSKNEPANSNWNLGKAEAAKGNIPIELHFNSPGGSTGLISAGLKRSLSPAEVALQNSFGVIGGDYGSPKYGVTMLELQGGAMRVNVDALADKFINAVSGKLGKVNEQPVSGGQPGGTNSAPPDMESSPKSLLATIPGMGNLSGSITSMFSMAGNIGSMMKGFMEGFTKASGIDLQAIAGGITSMAGSLFGQPAQSMTSRPAGSEDLSNLPAITGTGTEKGRSVMQALMTKGFTKEQAAGIVGNIIHESDHFRADVEYGGAGRGWIQWTGGRRTAFEQWCRSNNLNPRSNEANLGYLLREMSGTDGNHWTSGYSLEGLKRTKTVEEAATYFMKGYERPGVPHLDRRISYAKGVYGKQHGGYIDGSFRDGLSKQIISNSLELNNQEPVIIYTGNSNDTNIKSHQEPQSVPKNFGFEYITGSGDEFFIIEEFYGLMKLSSVV